MTAATAIAEVPLPKPIGTPQLRGPTDEAGTTRLAITDTSPSIKASGGAAPAFTTDDELILEVRTPQGELSDTIVAYGTRTGIYLPLGALARFLDLPIAVSDTGHFASGWFINEGRTLSINLRDLNAISEGKAVDLPPSDAAAFEGELYLKAERFGDFLPLTVTVNLRDQVVEIKTREPFPFEQRMDRENQRSRLGGFGKREAPLPREETPYRALTFPIGEAELRGVSDNTYGERLEGDLRLAGDFAFMTARTYLSATTRDGLVGARIQLGRRDPDAQLLGPLKATEYQLGDVSTLAMPLGLRGVSGRGALLTNAPLERASVFDTIDLRGELQQGYEVELYRNDILVGSTRTPVNGQFEFLKVPVDYGINVFRLVHYGPQGQRREETRRITVGDGRLAKGQLVYAFSGAQKDTSLINVHGPNFSPALDYGNWRSTAVVDYGLTSSLTATLGSAWFQSGNGEERWMATAGLRTGIGTTALKLDLGIERGGGKAVQFGLGGQALGIGYVLTHGEYSGQFHDEVRSYTGQLLRRATELNLNTSIRLRGGARPLTLPIYGQLKRYEFIDGRRQFDASLRSTLPLGNYAISHSLDYSSNSTPAGTSFEQLTGTFDLARLSRSRLHLRAGLDYSILPDLNIDAARFQADYALDEKTLVSASVEHALRDDRTYFQLSAARRLGPFSLAFDGSYGLPDGAHAAALRLGFSFGRNPLDGRLFVAEPGLTSTGAVVARAFRDANGSGKYEPGEDLLPDVEFDTNSQHGKTDARGTAFIGRVGDGNRARLTVNADTLPDITLAPVHEGIEFVPRAGRVHVSQFAMQELSTIDGSAYLVDAAGERGVSGLVLHLIGPDGKSVSRIRTAADGSFFFEQVRPGTYAVELDKGQAESLRIHLAEQVTVMIGATSATIRQVIRVRGD